MATLTKNYQQIESKYIGTVSGSGVSAKDLHLRIYAKYTSQSIVDNKSYVSYKSTLYVEGSGTYFYTGSTTTKTLSGTGATTISADAQGNYYVGETTLCETTGTITHGSNGAASVSITAGWSSAPWEVYGSLSGSADLPTIARATTPVLAATTITMGSAVNITLTPADSTFKHKLRYDFGSVSGSADGFSIGAEFTAQGNATVTFTPPTSLGSQIPNAMSGTGKVICYTYKSNGELVGTTSVNITLNVPSYTPTITNITLSGNGLLSGAYVKGKSTVTVNATLGTSYGANTKSIYAEIDGKTYSELPFETSVLSDGDKTAQITVTDTRDKSVTVESSVFTVYPYSIPNITDFTLERQTDGTTVKATVKGSISPINNKNAKTIKVALNGKVNTITSSGYGIDTTTTFTNVPTDSTLTGTASFKDSYTTIERAATLPTVAVTMDFYKDGNGIAMGKVAEQGDLLDVAWDMRVNGNINGVSISPDSYMNGGSKENITDEGWIADVPTFIGTYSQNDVWYNTISLRHRNGVGDGKKYGLQIRDELTRENSLSWRQHINGSWKDWRKLIDSKNISDYVTTPADYVVEQGTSDIWTYRKWNSGIAECWGIYEMGSACDKAWGGLYYSNAITPRINYPFTFKSRPQETVFLRINKYSAWLYADSDGSNAMNTTTQTARYGFLRPTTMGQAQATYEFTVIGKWK